MDAEFAVLQSSLGQAMALLGVTAKGRVDGLLFELSVEQRYRNPSSTNVEAVYTFPLPSGAVLLDFDVILGDKLLVGIVVEKQAAEGQYEDAIEQGDTAIMLERAGDGLLTVNLGNLTAGEEATIRYRHAQLLRFEHRSVRVSVPTVIAPRYGAPAQGGLQPHQAPVSDLAVEYPFALSLELRGVIATGTIASPSHAIATAVTADGVTVTLAHTAWLDRDFVLSASGLPAQSLSTVARDGVGYVALASFCAEVPTIAEKLPLRLKLLVDCSGSMAGDSIEAAKRALHRILVGLNATDRFSFTRFGSQVVHEIDALVAAGARAIRMAAARVDRTTADLGGTEMNAALSSVFALGGAEERVGVGADVRGGFGADVLLITDGEVWGSDALIAEAHSAQQRVFAVGIGSAPAEAVLRRLADATGGACEFVAPDEDAEAAILRMFARLRAPRVERADIVWPQAPKWVTPIAHGLFGGETIHVFAGFDSQPEGEVTLRLVPAGDGAVLESRVRLDVPTAQSRSAAVDAEKSGTDPISTCARMAAAMRFESANEDEKLALAMQYSLLTDRTNFIVVHVRAEGEKATALPELRAVPQMLAAGWGGVGSVAQPAIAYGLEVNSLDVQYSAIESATGNCESAPYDPTEFPADTSPLSYVAFLTALDQDFTDRGDVHLPESLAELATLGLDHRIEDELSLLVAAGDDERDVVRAFLAALVPWATRAAISRQLLRALRNTFRAPDECSELRQAVELIVGVPVAAPEVTAGA